MDISLFVTGAIASGPQSARQVPWVGGAWGHLTSPAPFAPVSPTEHQESLPTMFLTRWYQSPNPSNEGCPSLCRAARRNPCRCPRAGIRTPALFLITELFTDRQRSRPRGLISWSGVALRSDGARSASRSLIEQKSKTGTEGCGETYARDEEVPKHLEFVIRRWERDTVDRAGRAKGQDQCQEDSE